MDFDVLCYQLAHADSVHYFHRSNVICLQWANCVTNYCHEQNCTLCQLHSFINVECRFNILYGQFSMTVYFALIVDQRKLQCHNKTGGDKMAASNV